MYACGVTAQYATAAPSVIALLQFVVGKDGACGLCYEHSPSEGIAVVQLIEQLLQFMSVWSQHDLSMTSVWPQCDLSVTSVWHQCDISVTSVWPRYDLSMTSVWPQYDFMTSVWPQTHLCSQDKCLTKDGEYIYIYLTSWPLHMTIQGRRQTAEAAAPDVPVRPAAPSPSPVAPQPARQRRHPHLHRRPRQVRLTVSDH